MYIRYLLACLLAALLMPTSLIIAMSEEDIEAKEQQEIEHGRLKPVDISVTIPGIEHMTQEDIDNYMDSQMGSYSENDPDVEDAEDIDEDNEDSDDAELTY